MVAEIYLGLGKGGVGLELGGLIGGDSLLGGGFLELGGRRVGGLLGGGGLELVDGGGGNFLGGGGPVVADLTIWGLLVGGGGLVPAD